MQTSPSQLTGHPCLPNPHLESPLNFRASLSISSSRSDLHSCPSRPGFVFGDHSPHSPREGNQQRGQLCFSPQQPSCLDKGPDCVAILRQPHGVRMGRGKRRGDLPLNTHLRTLVHTCTHVPTPVHTYSVCVHVCTSIYMSSRVFKCARLCTGVYICVQACACVCRSVHRSYTCV